MNSFRSALERLWPWSAALLSGVLMALAFPPWNRGGVIWFALIPLICAIWFSPRQSRRPWLRSALLGYLSGIVFFSLTFSWLSSLGTLFSQPWLKGIPLLLSLYLALFFAFWGWFTGRILAPDAESRRFPHSWRNLATAAAGGFGWVLQEWTRGWLFSGFGWNGLGIALNADIPMIQIADLTGVLGLSFLVAFSNLMAVIVVRRILAELGPVFLKRIRWEFTVSVGLIMAVFAYGLRAVVQKPSKDWVALSIAAIQPNIPQNEKFSPESEDAIFEELGRLTKLAATSRPQLLLWPEAATPRGMYADEANFDFVLENSKLGEYAFLLGSTEIDFDLKADYNIAAFLTNQGREITTYRKIHLVPFGEYLPLRPIFEPIAGALVPGDFGRGSEYLVFDLPNPALKLSPLICFEDTLGDLTRRFVQNGAQLLVNLTNDGWFLQTAGPEQHLTNAVFRAVENRRPLVRCSNTGITCSVDVHGRVEPWLKPFQQGFAIRHINVPPPGPLTFYARHGDWIAWVSVYVSCIAIIGRIRGRHLK